MKSDRFASWARLAGLLITSMLAGAGCDCAGPGRGVGAPCESASDCEGGLVCIDDTCQVAPDGSVPDGSIPRTDAGRCDDEPERQCRGGRVCCTEGEECVEDFACAPICENTRCGDNGLTCCNAGQICLDGVVCAASCEANEALCGADLNVCCDAGQVCVEDACVSPGSSCGDDFDCLEDGTYCEPTIGACLPNPAPPLCEVRPDFADIDLEVEWHWEGVTVGGTSYHQVIVSPAVGDVSGDGVPDVVVPVYGSSDSDTILVALDGRTGALLFSSGPGVTSPQFVSMVALGNLDPSDDALEIVYRTQSNGILVLDGDGSTILAQVTTGSGATVGRVSPSLADMDHDGIIEVIAGCQVMSFETMGAGFTLRPRMDAGACNAAGQTFASAAVANLDGDGDLELTSGGAMYQLDGTRTWPAAGTPVHGIVAVADLDGNGSPEVISVAGGAVTVRDGATGEMRMGPGGSWHDGAVTIPGGGIGGAPTIADFDGDGMPEISTAGQGCYVVFDPDCLSTPPRTGGDCTRPAEDPSSTCDDAPGALLRWARPTQDLSSSVTGSSVFDFQGDGVSEVIYNDECFLHIYDGRDGREILAMPRPNSSRTALEYPLVVDVDRDGNSEIVLPANNQSAVSRDHCDVAYAAALGVTIPELPVDIRTGTFGVFALGDPMDRWVRTRPIWNQFTYHVTNVDDRGGIPMSEPDNWTAPGLNNYRQNVQGEGVFNAPNLSVTLDVIAACGDATLRLSAVVTNLGSRGVPAGVEVELLQTAPTMMSLDTVLTTRPLLPGASERLTITVAAIPYDTDLTYEARVDGASSVMPVIECNEDDNDASATERCPGID
jgi:hypothetical protein